MSPSYFRTCSPRSVWQPQLQDDSLHLQALTAQASPSLRAETAEELLVLKRVDLTIAPYFHAFPPYFGQWERRQSSNPHAREAMIQWPRDVNAYTSWVLEGAMSFICDFDHDIKQMADLIADIRAGSTNPAVPNIPVPLFSQPSRTGNFGTGFANWITKRYSVQAETLFSRLESYHFLEECIQDCQLRRDALWMELFELFPGETSTGPSEQHPTSQALQGPPLRGTQSLQGIPIHLRKEVVVHTTNSLGVSNHKPPEDDAPQRLAYRNIQHQGDVSMLVGSDTLPYRPKQ